MKFSHQRVEMELEILFRRIKIVEHVCLSNEGSEIITKKITLKHFGGNQGSSTDTEVKVHFST